MAAAAALHHTDGKRFSSERVSIDCARPSHPESPLVAVASAKHRFGPAENFDGSWRRCERSDMDVFVHKWRSAVPTDRRFRNSGRDWHGFDERFSSGSLAFVVLYDYWAKSGRHVDQRRTA